MEQHSNDDRYRKWSGDVTGLTAGVTTISYTNSLGCAATHNVTVNTMPSPIAGNSNVCLGGTTLLTDAVAGGTWSSTVPSIATIDHPPAW